MATGIRRSISICTPVQTARSEEHTSESSHRCISYAVFCLKKKMSETYDPFRMQASEPAATRISGLCSSILYVLHSRHLALTRDMLIYHELSGGVSRFNLVA